jgi:hypothetical protein
MNFCKFLAPKPTNFSKVMNLNFVMKLVMVEFSLFMSSSIEVFAKPF